MSFYQQLSHYYDILFPANPHQINFIEKYSNPNSRLLDIAAGSGNQAIIFAEKGYDVTAIDSAEDMVAKIAEKAENENVLLQVQQLTMEKIQLLAPSYFDSIICIGNSIVHLHSLEEIRLMVNDLYKLLENDGTLIIQAVNYDRILEEHIQELPSIKRDVGVTFERKYEHINEKILFHGKLIIETDGQHRQFENVVELYPLQSYQLVSVLQEAGFSEISLFGDFLGNEFSITAPAIIAVAKK